jgi:hypothetical protein
MAPFFPHATSMHCTFRISKHCKCEITSCSHFFRRRLVPATKGDTFLIVKFFFYFHSILKQKLYFAFCQIDVACGKNGAIFGISSGKGYLLLHETYAGYNVLLLKCFKISVFLM